MGEQGQSREQRRDHEEGDSPVMCAVAAHMLKAMQGCRPLLRKKAEVSEV